MTYLPYSLILALVLPLQLWSMDQQKARPTTPLRPSFLAQCSSFSESECNSDVDIALSAPATNLHQVRHRRSLSVSQPPAAHPASTAAPRQYRTAMLL